jgi:hypothetical protein
MTPKSTFIELKFAPKVQTIQIDLRKKEIKIACLAAKFIDKDTRQTVIHTPAFDITGYGETEDKAKEMFNFSFHQFCNFLIELKQTEITAELLKLGWKHSVIHPKEYSKTYVDLKGNLHEFNAKDDKVELVEIETTV